MRASGAPSADDHLDATSCSSPSLRSGLFRFGGRPAELFLLCWLIPPWILFELILTKLPHYTMPMYPALALLCARAVFAAETARLAGLALSAVRRALTAFWVLSMGIALAVVLAGALMPPPRGAGAVAGAVGAGAIMLMIAAINVMRQGRFVAAQVTLLAAGAALCAALTGLLAPAADHLWVTRQIAAQLPPDAPPVAAVGFHEDSLVYMLRGRLARIDPPHLGAWLAAHDHSIVIVPAELAPELRELEPIGVARGFNYARGSATSLVILRQGGEGAS